jgi:hypothetical protein
VIMLMTPGGKPACCTRTAILADYKLSVVIEQHEDRQCCVSRDEERHIVAHTVSGAFSELLSTTVFPTIRAGANLLARKSSGTFHGIMAATTPYG